VLQVELAVHVDDGLGFARDKKEELKLKALFEKKFKVKWESCGGKNNHIEFCGYEIEVRENSIKLRQNNFVKGQLTAVEFPKKVNSNRFLTPDEVSAFRKTIGQLRWVHRVDISIGYELARASSWVSNEECTVGHVLRLNKIVRGLKSQPPVLVIPKLDKNQPLHLIAVADAGEPPDDAVYRGRWHGCFSIGLTNRPPIDEVSLENIKTIPFVPLLWHSGLTRRVASSSFDGEALTGVEAVDAGVAIQAHMEESLTGQRTTLLDKRMEKCMEKTPGHEGENDVTLDLHSDSNDLVQCVRSIVPVRGFNKRRKCDVYDLRELLDLKILRRVLKIQGKTNPMDAGTKRLAPTAITMQLCRALQKGLYTPDYG